MIKVMVVSGGRADWGLLSPVCCALRRDPAFDLRVVVTGQHLMESSTSVQSIEDEGFQVSGRVDMGLGEDDSAAAVTGALGRGVCGFADEFLLNRPDLLLVLGDRYEILGAVQAALIAKIPVAHLCGGDITEGAMDDAIRHAMTKMSHLHFVTNEAARVRVIQMGENPDHVYCVGNPGLDYIHTMEKMSREAFFESIDFVPRDKNIIVTFHPVTLDANSVEQCGVMLDALSKLGADVGIVLTGSNADPEGAEITDMVRDYAAHNEQACFHDSLGSVRYLNALGHVDAMVGNSSSGLYEAPSFGLPSVNIGDRQKGRLKAPSVFDCVSNVDAIYHAVQEAVQRPRMESQNPYGDGYSSDRIVSVLKQVDYNSDLLRKVFVDIVDRGE